METGTTALFQLSAGIPVNTAKTLRVFPSEFLRACAYSAFRSLLQFEKTLQEFGRCKQAESPARKTPDENRRQVRRLKGKLGRGVTGLRSKRLGRAPCACRNKLPTCQTIGSFHQIEEPNKEGKRVRLMTHSVDLGLRFGANKSDQQSRRKPSLRDENLPISGRSLLVLCRVWKSFSLYSFFAARFSWFQRFPLPLLSPLPCGMMCVLLFAVVVLLH